MGCSRAPFPQPYLGLPLSPTKPPSNAFAPVVERSRKLMTGWRAKLLDKGDRLILISAVLDSLLTYFMSVFASLKKSSKPSTPCEGPSFGRGEILAQELNALLHGKMRVHLKCMVV